MKPVCASAQVLLINHNSIGSFPSFNTIMALIAFLQASRHDTGKNSFCAREGGGGKERFLHLKGWEALRKLQYGVHRLPSLALSS